MCFLDCNPGRFLTQLGEVAGHQMPNAQPVTREAVSPIAVPRSSFQSSAFIPVSPGDLRLRTLHPTQVCPVTYQKD